MLLDPDLKNTIIQFASLVMNHIYGPTTKNELRSLADSNGFHNLFEQSSDPNKRVHFKNFILNLYKKSEGYFLTYMIIILKNTLVVKNYFYLGNIKTLILF